MRQYPYHFPELGAGTAPEPKGKAIQTGETELNQTKNKKRKRRQELW